MARGTAVAFGRALLLICVICVFSSANPPVLPAGQWVLDWSDEFDGITVDTSKWTFETGVLGWGNNELQYNGDTANETVANGTLGIIAKHEYRENMHYTSARLASKVNRQGTYGYVEASMRVPDGEGILPLFWTLDASGNYLYWPADGSIVIHEKSGDTARGGICFSASGNGSVSCESFPHFSPQGLSSAFHRYGMYWDSLEVKWYLDDSLYGTAPITGLPQFHRPHYVILNLAIGGPQRAAIDTSAFPKTMYVDYVRWWKPSNTGVLNDMNRSSAKSSAGGVVAAVYDLNGKLVDSDHRNGAACVHIVKIVNNGIVSWKMRVMR
jgi:beta-glucanase (GH16 family)